MTELRNRHVPLNDELRNLLQTPEKPRESGFYVVGLGYGGAHGPLKDSSLRVHVVAGKYRPRKFGSMNYPIESVEKVFELLRYHDESTWNNIYIVRYPLDSITFGMDDNAVPIPSTSSIHGFFDEIGEKFDMVRMRNAEAYWRVFEGVRQRLGLQQPERPGEGASRREVDEYVYLNNTLARHIEDQADLPDREEVVVSGDIVAILNKIEITSLLKP